MQFPYDISIITIVYNRYFDIEKTIQSIVNQDFKSFQLILVDGNSTDGTIDIINKYKSENVIVISEKDNGIYDAMNKGLKLASGEYILYINGGDMLYSNTILSEIFSLNKNKYDVIFGDCMFIDENEKSIDLRTKLHNKSLPLNLSLASFRYGNPISHQSFIAKRNLVSSYDLQYKIAADLDWMMNIVSKGTNFLNSNNIISKYLAGGTSHEHKVSSWVERFMIFKKYFGYSTFIDHIVIIYRVLKTHLITFLNSLIQK